MRTHCSGEVEFTHVAAQKGQGAKMGKDLRLLLWKLRNCR